MKITTEKLHIKSKGNCDIVNITNEVISIVNKSNITDGIVNVFVTGSTASISTIEYEPGLKKDLPQILEELIPSRKIYHHNKTWGDNNGHAHLRSTLFGCSVTIPLSNGELILGTWQQLVLIDFDDRSRQRQIIIQVMGE